MAAIAVKFQSLRNNGLVLIGFGLLGFFSQAVSRALSQYRWGWPGKQMVQVLPIASLCHLAVSWTPAGEWLGGFCPWFSLLGVAVKVLCGAL